MHDPQILLKRHRTHRGSDQHLAASLQISSITEGAGQGGHDEVNPLQRNPIAHRMKHRAGVTFDAMRQSVRARGRGQFGRQVPGENGIEDHLFGEQSRMKQHRLTVGSGKGDYRTASNFASRSRRSRNGDQRGEVRPIAFGIEFAKLEPGTFHQQPRGLPDIQWAPAAEGDDAVATVLAERLCGLDHILFDRVGMDPGKQMPGLSACGRTQGLLQEFKGVGPQ
jgi:hypothetical protein